MMHLKRKGWGKYLSIALTFAFILQCFGMVVPEPAQAATTQLTISKYAVDGTTVLERKTVDYHWLENPDNIDVLGDGVTHYYHQGPVFIDNPDQAQQELLRWNQAEDQNWDTKDMGAVKGNNVKDLCNLVGGMAAGDTLQIKASDGFKKSFAYENIYNYSAQEGPMVVSWYKDGKYPDTGYTDGMRLVWFAEATYKEGPTSIAGLPTGNYHVFGNWDWHEAADSQYWYYYNNQYPTTTGLSVQNISELKIYSNEPVPAASPVLTADASDNVVGQAIDISFSDDPDWRAAITDITINGSTLTSALYTVTAGNIHIAEGVFTAANNYTIAIKATGYSYASVSQSITALAAAPTAAFTADKTSGTVPLTVQFTDQSTNEPTAWEWDFNNDGTVDSTVQNPSYEYSAVGTYSVKLTTSNSAGTDEEVKTDYIAITEAPTMDILYEGTVNLTPDQTFNVTAYSSSTQYTVNETTPLGALQAAATAAGFTYVVTDKNYTSSGALLLDNIGNYPYVKGASKWYAYVNDVYKDGYNNAAGALNLIELVTGDKVEYYYAAGISNSSDLSAVKAAATAAVKTVAATGVAPTNWALQLSGARNETVNKAYFEQGLACLNSGHYVEWTDSDGNKWGGVPLWLLVAMVDDDPDVGDKHYNFNDELAAQDYEIKVIAGDGWSTTLSSADIARSDAYIVANTLNGEPLPLMTESGKDCWPLYLKGSAISGGQQVGNIVRIELSGLPETPAGWTLEMIGEVGDIITQAEFEEGLACTGSGHYQEWTDKDGKVWSGVPLWVLLGAVDDIETGSHWTFNDTLAADYTVKVSAPDFSRIFNGADVVGSNDYIVANKYDGAPLVGDSAPLRLVGKGVTKDDGSLGGSAVGNITSIEIPELQTPAAAPGSWNLTLNGKISDVISQAEFEAGLACPHSGHLVEWTDGGGNKWSGIPLWYLAGWVDDRQPHSYDFIRAVTGYKVLVKAGDGYSVDFESADISKNSNYIIANKCNGQPLTNSGPLRLVGTGVAKTDGTLSGKSVGNIVEIELTSFATGGGGTIPELHIVKYAEDGTTILAEETLDYVEMQSRFDVIGDGTTVYKYEGITNNAADIWDADQTYPGGFKIANAVKGTRIKDLVELVGGMGTGTDIVFKAKDGWETTLPYSSIYTDPSVQARQGDAILAWYADGKYVPDYADGMRLFFTPEDHVYGQWDMHETLSEPYWHYYYGDVMYPSCAGLSPKYITDIKVYSIPAQDWNLKLDGQDLGGLVKDISKTYFESALTCTMGANHKASYTDSENQVWEGMPLWFLAGFVDDADQHSDNAFNNALATAGYQVVITAKDGYSVTIDSADIIRNNNYIVANTLNGTTIPETDGNWPLRLVGSAVSGSTSIGQIESIKLLRSATDRPIYRVLPMADAAYTAGTTAAGISTMTVNAGVSGFKYFTANITPVTPNTGLETVVFTHLRNDSMLQINSTRADFDQVGTAQAGFNVQARDVIKVYIVDELTNAADHNPVIFQ